MSARLEESYTVRIERMGQSGQGVAYLPDGRIFFVDDALPGELVRAQVTQVKPRYAKGRIETILEPSSSRITPVCSYAEQCGGCSFQHWDYRAETEYKQEWVRQALKRIAKIPEPPLFPIVPATGPDHYRNKGQFPWGQQGQQLSLGLYARGSHQLVELASCLIQDEGINRVLRRAPELARPYHFTAYQETTGQGLLRHLLIRSARATKDLLVLIVATAFDPNLSAYARDLMADNAHIKGVGLNINTERTNRILGPSTRLLHGQSTIIDQILGLSFHVSFESFFQVNPEQVERLYRLALDNIPESTGVLWDLYAGVGTLASLASARAQKVYAIELNSAAASDARKNFALNGLHNIQMITGRVEDVIDENVLRKPDVVLMDPPRKGVDSHVLSRLKRLHPSRIVYISCNPDTLARDVQLLSPEYRLTAVTPVDMFPRTDHVEAVAVLDTAQV
ncbi:MAG: 23S rRNA (uracil(1939)-C(5))-methyltransferase RlmD [Sulfobacillus thermosulfidooxidans]|nr:MAG: 23S rRNA (uracil(1939)-C(5))-methyltransferase RlmD [Sulfobacillus thermosulfidooxidans]